MAAEEFFLEEMPEKFLRLELTLFLSVPSLSSDHGE